MPSKADESFLEAKQRKKQGSKGKGSEAVVEQCLKQLKARHQNFDYDRLPDSRAAGGRPMPARASDFTVFCGGAWSLEVKEIKKGFRLDLADFPQFPRMRRRALAGCRGIVLVHLLEHQRWVWLDVEAMDKAQKSWNLSGILWGSAKEILDFIFPL